MNIPAPKANELFRFKKKVLCEAFSLDFDEIDLAESCVNFYKNFLGLEIPSVIVAQGPKQAIEFLNHIKGKKECKELSESYPFMQDADYKSIDKIISSKVYDEARHAKEFVKKSIGIEWFKESRNILLRDLNYQLSQTVHHPVAQAVYNLCKTDLGHFEMSLYPSFADWDWVKYHRGINSIFRLVDCLSKEYERFLDTGLFGAFLFDRVAILMPKPSFISKNDELVLHNEDGPAVQWKDGTSLCFWNGVEIPLKLICHPEKVTSEDILKETNAEVRRCYQEALGSEKFGSLLGLEALDRKSDRFGNELILYRTKERDKLAGGYIYFAKVVCPSTGRIYFLCVPPGFNTVEEAVSWTFGKTPGEYQPIIET
ncbi:MAG: hypothetical protein MK086_02565 [Flavobacteriales bacterium]|nr:hypothetical protein [Flavobacteriales bacterium]